jgi:hypothetical protein
MKVICCTISTNSHLHKVEALFNSLIRFGVKSELACLATENGSKMVESGRLIRPGNLGEREADLRSRFKQNSDHLRWCLKPVLVSSLLEVYDKVIYLDNDTFFFDDPSFLFDELDNHDILLTPHHYPRDPNKNQNWLEANFKVGLFNAGFIAVNKNAKHIMDWWAECCLYRCEKSLLRGLFDDQKYLDLIPIMHPDTKILEHKGCNVAGWNTEVCERVEQPDSSLLIDNKWPIVFIHFNGFTNRAIVNGDDPLLKPYFDEYLAALQNQDSSIKAEDLWKEDTRWDQLKLAAWKFLDRFNK